MKVRRFIFLSITCIVLAGCAHRRMLIGIYDAPLSALPTLRNAGFNLVTMAPTETSRLRFLDEAHASDIQVILAPSLDTDVARRTTACLDKHPALWGWYLQDEPDLNIIAPETLLARKKKLRSVARGRALVVLASGAAIEKFRNTADIIAVDWYPIPWAPLATISREMRAARLASRGRPFLAVLQAFDWTAYQNMLVPPEKPLRAPSYEELRCMAFLSLFQGASGLLFYTYQSGEWKTEEHPQTWQALTNVVAEVRDKSSIFQQRVDWWPNQTKYEGSAADMYNDIHEGSIALNLFHVSKQDGSIKPGYYFVAINTSQRPVTLSFRLPFRDVSGVNAFGNPGETVLRGGWLQKRYLPFEVFILGPITAPLVLDRLP